MLRLENIVKKYKVADQEIPALKGLTLSFRKSEFVSILGPSGCGKTTTLNIIGGLDKYTSGDLFINGRSTKEFGDRDWDVYRNHRVGFIFQSYNLIPHQTILENVELALTIAGVDKAERVERSKKALDEVGLSGQYNKKPNQLSGGQCQRVAIARALVNDPEILLADEPTGALDTVTSVQIMELIKKISENKLVIMVTHNPELAEKYSTRIVRLLDGELQDDSNPFTSEDEIAEVAHTKEAASVECDYVPEGAPQVQDAEAQAEGETLYVAPLKEKKKKDTENAKMSLWTAFKLSARNLRSKLKRTIMVALAGCIGIVGVSTVLAVSTGVKGFIGHMQNDMISGYPITVSESGMDYTALLNSSSTMKRAEAMKAGDYVNVNSMIEYLVDHKEDIENMFISQDLNENYHQFIKDMPKEYYDAISIDYGIDISTNLYTDFTVSNTGTTLPAGYANTHTYSVSAIKEIYTALLKQTDYKDYASIITGLQTPISQEIDNYDYILDQYDLVYGEVPKNKNEMLLSVNEDGEVSDLVLAQLGFYTQEEFFNLIYNSLDENFDSANNPYKKKFEYSEILDKDFYWYPNDSVFTKTGATYSYSTEKPSGEGLHLKVTGIIRQKKNIDYGSLSSAFYYSTDLTNHMLEVNKNSEIVTDIKSRADGEQFISGVMGLYEFVYREYNTATSTFGDYVKHDSTEIDLETMRPKYGVMYLGSVDMNLGDLFTNPGALMSSMVPKLHARELGGVSVPSRIEIYAKDFKIKDKVTSYLDKWNSDADITLSTGVVLTADDRSTVKYNDTVGLIMSMITSMVDLVTIALVAFTALSLVVSTVMVGIITYVSVVERTKEIGVIRSLGGRKKDVSHLFNAETFIIGLSSGIVGILITAIISGILNLIVSHYSSGIKTIADLTVGTSVVMIALSVCLTLISGIIPSRAAAKQDPVNALRSE